MTEIEIYGTGRKGLIPSSWDEMSAEQIQGVFRIYDECTRQGLSTLDFSVRVLYFFLGIRPSGRAFRRRMRYPARRARHAENVYRLCDSCLGYLFTEGEDTGDGAKLAYASVVNSLPEIRGVFGRPLIGPADLLQDLSFGEFRHAATALNAFFQSHDVQDLDECIAHLYRRRSNKTNRCGRFVSDVDNATFYKDVKRVSRLLSWQKNLIMMWFAACLKYLQTDTVIIDGEAVNMSLLFASEEAGHSDVSFSWNDLLVQIARDQTIGTIDRVDQEPLFSIFSLMWTNYKENQRYERNKKTDQGK